jgi:protein-S-isoprenylcysteine O-methyltransferase Ste14
MLALPLLLAAGTTDFWQARLYIAVFGGCSLLVTLYLLRYDRSLLARRVKAGPVAEQQRGQKIVQSLASLCFFAQFLVAGLDRRFRWSHVPDGLSVASDVLVALGFGVVFLTFRANSYASAVIEVASEQRVISTGPYRFVRHPMYTGASVLLVFTPLALGSWWALPAALLLILVIAFRAIEEEKFLAAELRGYEAYRQRVPSRLVPFVW